jgi:hydroxymethylbilane synthase
LAKIENKEVWFRGNIVSPDGRQKVEIEGSAPLYEALQLGVSTAENLLQKGGAAIVNSIRSKGLASDGEV